MNIAIDTNSQIPLYQQLVLQIRLMISEGTLKSGGQLPAVRKMADMTGLAPGTVKHAYDQLEHSGMIEKATGRGTFVSQTAQALPAAAEAMAASRRDLARQAIDDLFAKLSAWQMPPAQARQYLEHKLHVWEQADPHVSIGIIDCTPEALSVICSQISALPHADVHACLLDEVMAGSVPFGAGLDLVITTTTHIIDISPKLDQGIQILPVVMSVAPDTIFALARIPADARVGILAESPRFAANMAAACRQYCSLDHQPEIALFGALTDPASFAARQDHIILPPDPLQYCTEHDLSILRAGQARLIIHQYQIDQGSLLYLQRSIERLHHRILDRRNRSRDIR